MRCRLLHAGCYAAVLGLTVSVALAQQFTPTAQASAAASDPTVKAPPIDPASIDLGFQLSATGGIIDVMAKEGSARPQREALKRFAEHLRDGIGTGEFGGLLVLFPKIEADVRQLSKTRGVASSVLPVPAGYRISFGASDQESRTVIHNLIRNARGKPGLTAEERAMNHPGNNLGWDAQRDPSLER